MSEKKSSGCAIAAAIGVAVLLAGVALIAIFAYRGVRAGKAVVSAQIEKHRAEAARVEAEAAAVQPVELHEGKLPDYSGYQAGQPLERELFLAWRVDDRATTLVRETFAEKVEGAEVCWALRAGDLRQEGDRISGSFYLPYVLRAESGPRTRSGVESIRCEFAAIERESLLNIRRDRTVTIRGKLSLKQGETRLLDARQAGTGVEKE
jgi:hypothetical protein